MELFEKQFFLYFIYYIDRSWQEYQILKRNSWIVFNPFQISVSNYSPGQSSQTAPRDNRKPFGGNAKKRENKKLS